MKIVVRRRGSGKTTELIKECAAKGGYIVCHNDQAARHIQRLARKMNLSIPFPLTFEEFTGGHYYSAGVRRVYIDNLELCIKNVSRVPIETITMSSNDGGI